MAHSQELVLGCVNHMPLVLIVFSVSGTLRIPTAKEYVRRPSTLLKMTLEEKEEFIEELCKRSRKAVEILKSLKKKDIIELINIEMGQERSLTSTWLTSTRKPVLIFQLCGIISTKTCQNERMAVDSTDPVTMAVDSTDPVTQFGTFSLCPMSTQTSSRSKRKSGDPSRLPLFRYCQNAACQAKLKVNDIFCKRCSCHICHRYDENKTPSFWLVCESETQSQGKPCGLSCHLECALKVEGLSNMTNNSGAELDGSLTCRNCGSVNDLISCWRKLLMEAKDARRVSDLCSRVYLSHKILNTSEKYRNLHEIVDSVKCKLVEEVGSLNNLPVNMSRSLVRRLTCGSEAQKHCSRAIGLLDSLSLTTSQFNCIESLNCEVGVTNENSLEGNTNVHGVEVKEDKPESKELLLIDLNEFPECHIEDTHSIDGEIKTSGNEIVAMPISTHDLVPPPCMMEECSKGSKDRNEIKIGCKENADGYSDMKYRLTVNTMRQLERDGHIDSSFRKEFLTWLSMRATPKYTMQVSVFLDIFADDPKSLAEQLVHTFGEEVRAA